MFFEKNTQALLKADVYHAPLVEQLRQLSRLADTEAQLLQTEDGQYTLLYRNVLLHDAVSPEQEARAAFAECALSGAKQVHILVALGLGYGLSTAYEASPGRILVYEPDMRLLRFTLENVDLSAYFSSGRVWLACTVFDVLELARPRIHFAEQLDIIPLKGYLPLLPEPLSALIDRLSAMADDVRLDYQSAEDFHALWLQRFFENLSFISTATPVTALSQRFAGKPAVLISRGPSLDAALPSLARLQERAVLVAVGGALRRLWESGITPDFAIFYDANGMHEQLHGLPDSFLENIYFVLHPSTQPCCFTSVSRGQFIFMTQYNRPMATWLESALGIPCSLMGGGGTVSVIALRLALLLGCDPIVLIGQDLAFPNNQVYAGGVALQTDAQGKMALPATDTLYALPEALSTVVGQHGETLTALHAYPMFIRQLERIAVENARSPQPAALYNASLGGAQLEGFPLCNLSVFVEQWPAWKLSQRGGLPVDITRTSLSDVIRQNEKLVSALNVLHELVRQNSALCAELAETLSGLSNPHLVPAQLQQTLVRLGTSVDRDPFLAFFPAFEMLNYRRLFLAVLANQTSASSSVKNQRVFHPPRLDQPISLQAECIQFLSRCEQLFKQLDHWIEMSKNAVPLELDQPVL